MNNTVRIYFIFLFTFFTFSLVQSPAFACDDCIDNNGNEREPGATWCEDGIVWACGSCEAQSDCVIRDAGAVGNQCYTDPSKTTSNYDSCDKTCPSGASGKFTYNTNNTCTCVAREPQRPILEIPADNSITAADYEVNKAGYQVLLDWAYPNDWGADCQPQDDWNYEIFVSQNRNNMPDINQNVPLTARKHNNEGSWYTFTGQPGVTYYWTVRFNNGVRRGQPATVRRFTVNNAPTANITNFCVGSNCTTISNNSYNNPYTFNTGTTYRMNVTLSDLTPNMNRVEFVKVGINNPTSSNPSFGAAPPTIFKNCQNATTCTQEFTWTPTTSDVGEWWIYVNGYDSNNLSDPNQYYGKCTGRPTPIRTPSNNTPHPSYQNWSNCGPTSRFRVTVNSTVSLTGVIWDSTSATSCTIGRPAKLALAIPESTVATGSRPVKVTLNDPSKTVDYGFGSNSYTITGVPHNNNPRSLSITPFLPSGLPNFRYILQCATTHANSTLSPAPTSSSSASFRTTQNAQNILDLGYALKSTGWYTSNGGDIYAGYTHNTQTNLASIIAGIPQNAPAGSISNYLIQGSGHRHILVANQEYNVVNSSNQKRVSANANMALSKLRQTNTWPGSYSYSAPSNTTIRVSLTTPNCQRMFRGEFPFRTDKVYVATTQCINDAFNNSSNPPRYAVSSIAGGRIAVVYVNGNITIPKSIDTAGNNRLLFVVNGKTTFTNTYGIANGLQLTTAPHIKASFMSKTGITYNGTANALTSPDTSLVVEGPIITGGTSNSPIVFQRDRGVNNDYPGTMVTYNSDYMYFLTKQERASAVPNYTGLSISKVEWEID